MKEQTDKMQAQSVKYQYIAAAVGNLRENQYKRPSHCC